MKLIRRAPLHLVALLLACACSSTATEVDTFTDPADATRGIVAAVAAGDEAEAERIFSTFARSSVLRDSVFDALVEGASAATSAGDAEAARRLVEFAQRKFPGAGFETPDALAAALAGAGGARGVEEAAAAAAEGRAAQDPLEPTDWDALEATRRAIEAGDLPAARESFDAFIRTWDGEPADLQDEVNRISQQLVSG